MGPNYNELARTLSLFLNFFVGALTGVIGGLHPSDTLDFSVVRQQAFQRLLVELLDLNVELCPVDLAELSQELLVESHFRHQLQSLFGGVHQRVQEVDVGVQGEVESRLILCELQSILEGAQPNQEVVLEGLLQLALPDELNRLSFVFGVEMGEFLLEVGGLFFVNVRIEVLDLFAEFAPDAVLQSLELRERNHPQVDRLRPLGNEEPILQLVLKGRSVEFRGCLQHKVQHAAFLLFLDLAASDELEQLLEVSAELSEVAEGSVRILTDAVNDWKVEVAEEAVGFLRRHARVPSFLFDDGVKQYRGCCVLHDMLVIGVAYITPVLPQYSPISVTLLM